MKNPARLAPCRGIHSVTSKTNNVTEPNSPAQAPSILGDGISLGAIWRGPRDRSRAIQFSFREFNGTEFLDIRQYDNSSGYMVPTTKGITISVKQLGRFAQCAGNAYREAVRRGLVTARSSS